MVYDTHMQNINPFSAVTRDGINWRVMGNWEVSENLMEPWYAKVIVILAFIVMRAIRVWPEFRNLGVP
jgi:hypothetical protein